MKLDIQKIYIDTRFRTKNSKSETDFSIELPRSFNVPDGVTAYIDDIVIPVSWNTVDERNRHCFLRLTYGDTVKYDDFYITTQNYTGSQFATELESELNIAIHAVSPQITADCIYNLAENMLNISIADYRLPVIKSAAPFVLEILTDEEIGSGSDPRTLNTIIRNTTPTLITEGDYYQCYLDLFQTRNLYLTSSALASYDTISNFGNDTIIKKIPCTTGYNTMLTLQSGSSLDGLDVSKRTLRFIDFKLVDTSFRTIPLQGNHFSFSIVFTQKR